MDIIGGQHLRQMWDDLADVYGHKTALICESSGGVVNRYSYLELNQEINRTANLFYTLGIRKGDKVALHLDNCPEFIFCWFGLAKIGAIMVPINARLLREESAWILQNSQACLLVTSAQFYPMYQQIQQEDATQLRHICLTDVALPADDGVSSFTQLKNQQPATLCYAPPLLTDDTAEILFDLMSEVSKTVGIDFEFANLGGGIGIPYRPEQEPVDFEKVGAGIREVYERHVAAGLAPFKIYFECGRVITGPYGWLVARVRHIKKTYRTYVGLDACMANLMRPALYGAYHHITVAGKEQAPATMVCDVTGSLCENNDKFAVQRALPETAPGDLLIIHDAGAHGHAMGFQYNGKLRSAELLLKEDGSVKQIRRAETLADYFATLDFPGL